MLSPLRTALVLAVLAAAAPVRAAVVLDFEHPSVSPAYPSVPVATGYGGLVWNTAGKEIFSMDGPAYFSGAGPFTGVGFANAPVTGPRIAWTGVQTARVSLGAGALSFDFYGAWFTQAVDSLGFDGVPQTLSFEGRAGGITLYSSGPFQVSWTGPQHFISAPLGWLGLDELLVHNSLWEYDYPWAMDNFEYTLHTPPPAVPLPPAVMLFASGLALLARRRR